MNLTEIFSQVKTQFTVEAGAERLGEVILADVAIDSRKISAAKPAIFFALDGKTKSGEEFIESAVLAGAQVVVAKNFSQNLLNKNSVRNHGDVVEVGEGVSFYESIANKSSSHSLNLDSANAGAASAAGLSKIIFIKTTEPFALLVEVLKIFYAALPANIYAVTGTNGKTSTAEFIRQIIALLGKKSASIGTLGVVCDEALQPMLERFDLTTPDIVSLYKNLAILRANGVDDVALEVSSIGLEQARIAGLKLAAAGFTNFTQDHLDYHKTMEEYFFCKMLLFEAAMPNGSAVVLNADITEFTKIKRMCQAKKHHILEYGFKAVDLKLLKLEPHGLGQVVEFEFAAKKYSLQLNVSGEFQVYNMLCALGLVMARHYLAEDKFSQLLTRFTELHTADGRMQRVASLPNGAQVFVDFAHSPDALENVLKLARGLLNKGLGPMQKFASKAVDVESASALGTPRLLVLFGCGGDRDNKKRPIMGEVASRLADVIIVTDDNPRSERPESIRAEILATCDMARTFEIADRRLAIKKSLEMLKPHDILILAGKGHEKYQIIGSEKFVFDEVKIVKEFLASGE